MTETVKGGKGWRDQQDAGESAQNRLMTVFSQMEC